MEKLFLFIIVLFIIAICLKIVKIMLQKNKFKKRRPKIKSFGQSLYYTDDRSNNVKCENRSTLLISERYGLRGKPDYIFKNRLTSALVPVELKSSEIRDANEPRKNELMQLVTYFLIVEDVFGKAPRYGKLVYKDCMFVVKNTTALKSELLSILNEMDDMLESGEGIASPSFINCRHCICRGSVCEHCQ